MLVIVYLLYFVMIIIDIWSRTIAFIVGIVGILVHLIRTLIVLVLYSMW